MNTLEVKPGRGQIDQIRLPVTAEERARKGVRMCFSEMNFVL